MHSVKQELFYYTEIQSGKMAWEPFIVDTCRVRQLSSLLPLLWHIRCCVWFFSPFLLVRVIHSWTVFTHVMSHCIYNIVHKYSAPDPRCWNSDDPTSPNTYSKSCCFNYSGKKKVKICWFLLYLFCVHVFQKILIIL